MKKEINNQPVEDKYLIWYNRNTRHYLKDILPIRTPIRVDVATTNICNFKCNYCAHSTFSKINAKFLSLEFFDKILENISEFDDRLKCMAFVGLGEPLLNRNIYEMIKRANKYIDDTTLITNGSLLTKDNADKLIDSNVKTVRISLQGINEQDYYNVSQYKINFNQFIENIEYFYKNKPKNTKLYLQMADISIKSEEKKKLFEDLFSDKCDNLVVNKIMEIFYDVDYSNIVKPLSVANRRKTCSQMFLNLMIDLEGNVSCCSVEKRRPIYGNIYNESLVNIWNGKIIKEFRLKMLKDGKSSIYVCKDCLISDLLYNNEYDNIDPYMEDLLKRYE